MAWDDVPEALAHLGVLGSRYPTTSDWGGGTASGETKGEQGEVLNLKNGHSHENKLLENKEYLPKVPHTYTTYF